MTQLLHRLHYDASWTVVVAITVAALGAAITTLAYTAWSPER